MKEAVHRRHIRKFSDDSRRSGAGDGGGNASVGESAVRRALRPCCKRATGSSNVKRPDLALALWNGLAPRMSYPPLNADSLVTNGSFGRSPTSHGFDWHLMTVEGMSSFLNVDPSALGFEFSGEEPDSFTLMNQAVPVQAGKSYRLAVDYGTSGIAPGSGIEWSVTEQRTGAVLGGTGCLSAEQGGEAYACFSAPDGTAFVNLSLDYRRQPGTVRVEGKLALKGVRLSHGQLRGQEKLWFRG